MWDVGWIQLAQDRVQGGTVVKTVLKLKSFIRGGGFLH
jgi:hypothetical protein